MAREVQLTERRMVSVTKAMAAAIDDFRFGNRIASEAEAIRLLLERGLAASKPPKKPKS